MTRSKQDNYPVAGDDAEDEVEFETNLLNVVAGDRPGEYLILANWGVPGEPEEIHACVLSMQLATDHMQSWTLEYTWVHILRRLTSDSLLLGTSDGDLVCFRQGKAELIKTSLINGGVSDIWVIDAHDCWLAHGKGVSHWDGHQLSYHMHTASVAAIHALSPDFAVAVGDNGLVLKFDGKQWQKVGSSPTKKHLVSVFCVSREEIIIGGWSDALYKWDGKQRWQRVKFVDDADTGDHDTLSLVQYMADIYACVGGNGLYTIQGTTATQIQDFYCGCATVIDDALIVTGMTQFTKFDGTDWIQVDIQLPDGAKV